MVHFTADTLSGLVSEAIEACRTQPQYNLVLHGEYPYAETDSDYVGTFKQVAADWQEPSAPPHLYFNHGEYIHRYNDPWDFLLHELTRRTDPTRACLSLVDMHDILASREGFLPSFLLLQFGFPEGDRSVLSASAYFRALEVSAFLPINIAEICQYIRRLKESIPEIERFLLTIFAYKAHYVQRFSCFRKPLLEAETPVGISVAVAKRDLPTLREYLESKIHDESSVVSAEGLRYLVDAVVKCKEDFPEAFVRFLGEALQEMESAERARKAISYGPEVAELNRRVRAHLAKAHDALEQL